MKSWMLKPMAIFFFLVCLLGRALASESDSLWQRGNTLYQQGDFAAAAQVYSQLEKSGVSAAVLDYNLGNAFYRLNEYPKAILYYERALRKQPKDRAIQENLSLAKSKVQNPLKEEEPVFFIRWWTNAVHLFGVGGAAFGALLLFLSALSLLYVQLSGAAPIPFFRRWLGGTLSFFVLFLIIYFSALDGRRSNKGVVMREHSEFFSEFGQSKSELSVPAGTVVRIKETEGGRLRVRLPNGAEGWMAAPAIQKVVP